MAFLFLLWSVVYAVLTYNVFRPLQWSNNGLFTFSTFILGWLVGDLAPHWIVFNLGVVLLFYFGGALESIAGQFALILTMVSCLALVFRMVKLFRLPPLVQQQMRTALGNDYEQKILPPFRQHLTPFGFDWNVYWNPTLLLKNPKIDIIRDIVFHENDDSCLKLDVYRPQQHTGACPVLLQIHGGAWTVGTKIQGIPLMTRMAAAGWICFAITYRLSPQTVFPAHLIDCKRAINWIKEQGIAYGANPDFIVVTGGSAGAHLAALTALTPNHREFQPGFEEIDTNVQGCVAFYGIYDFITPFQDSRQEPLAKLLKIVMGSTPEISPELYRQASPVRQVSEKPPPFLILQGEIDALVSINEAKQFYQVLQEANTPHLTFLQLPLVEHAFDTLPTLPTQSVLPAVEQYLSLLRTEYVSEHLQDDSSVTHA